MPMPTVIQPASLNACGSARHSEPGLPAASTPDSRKDVLKLYTRVESGRRPDMNELRDGEQTACCT